ncbi:MAG TPA: peroxiredoxin [Solirubrobacter sp.]|nr:peroxiredoxin [Solirubrobacter sp.]
MTTNGSLPRAVHELEEQFARLGPDIPDGPEKQAISVLHGIVMELWRNLERERDPDQERALQDIADLWKVAPPMEGEAVNEPLPVGTEAPDFALPDASGELVRLSDFRGRPVVLVFYPLDWSPGCSQQLDLYQQEIDEFRSRGAQVLAVSVDSIYSHGAWAAVRGLSFPLLADFHPKGEVARRYGVWREQDGFSERALYVIDPVGRIAYSHVSPYLHHVPDIDELLDAVDAVREQVAA